MEKSDEITMEKSDDGVSKAKQIKLSVKELANGQSIEERDSQEGSEATQEFDSQEEGEATQKFDSQEEGEATQKFDSQGGGDTFKNCGSEETVAYSPDLGSLADISNAEKNAEEMSLNKLNSVFEDAKFIAEILNHVEVNDIYDRLKSIRSNPNRIEVVTNELLEKQSSCKDGKQQKSGSFGAQLMKDFVKVIDLTTSNMPALPVSAEDIQDLLDAVQGRHDRVDFVFSQILGLYCLQRQGHGDLVKETKNVLVQCPGVMFEEVSKLMVKDKDNPNRVQSTLNKIIPNIAVLSKTDSSASNISLNEDLVYRDTRIISKVLPEVDRNEIYAYLEAHHHEKNRIRVVIDELMKFHPVTESLESSDTTSSVKPFKGITCIQDEVDELRQIFPDCDPNYLYDQLEQREHDKERMKSVAMLMFENKSYPKLQERKDQEMKTTARNQLKNLTFDFDSFLLKFSDPVTVFEKNDRKMNENYRKHVEIQLRNTFPQLKGQYLKKMLEDHGYHLTACQKQIEADVAYDQLRGHRKKFKARVRTTEVPLPNDPDEFFYYEKLYLHNEKLIKDQLEEKEQLLLLKRNVAKEKGELFECSCCFDNECMFEEMSSCADGHLFCKECIRRSSEVIIGDSKTKFPCLLNSCKEEFPLSVLQDILSCNTFSILLRRLQEEEIKQADIPDLVSCPFCSFATIMPEEDRIFKCLNPDCLKESCRLCKEPNHVPYRCEEVEKQGETSMRTFIETKLSEAMLRTCHRCNKRFMKEIGCNKMTCVCGASMCYVCREPDIDYDHFTGSNCTEANMKELHLKEMKEAAISAKEQYLLEHPECAEIDLKFDPIKLVNEFESNLQKYGEDDDDDDEDDNDADYYE